MCWIEFQVYRNILVYQASFQDIHEWTFCMNNGIRLRKSVYHDLFYDIFQN